MALPKIRLPETLFCIEHMLQLVPEHEDSGVPWPPRKVWAITRMTELILADPRVQAKIHAPHMASAILSQVTPFCCFLPADQLPLVTAYIDERTAWLRAQAATQPVVLYRDTCPYHACPSPVQCGQQETCRATVEPTP